jgi:DNA-binding transcriptional regulator YiaG
MQGQLTLRGTSSTPAQAAPALPTFQADPHPPVREWTGRDAVALRKALRMTEAKFARAVDVSPRTVANWHTKPETVPRNAAQTCLTNCSTARLRRSWSGSSGSQGTSPRQAGPRRPRSVPLLLRRLVRRC